MSIIRLSERLKNPIRKDGPSIEIYVYSFLTTEPNAPTVSINHERMPASSEGIEFERRGCQASFALVRSFEEARMTAHKFALKRGWQSGVRVRRCSPAPLRSNFAVVLRPSS